MILALMVGVLAAIRIVGLLQTDDFGPVQDLRRWWLNKWPGKLTEFYDSEVTGDDTYGYTLRVSGRTAFLDHYEELETGTISQQIPKFVAFDPHPLGELWECPRCVGYWIVLFVVLGWLWLPWFVWWAIMLPLAMAQGVIWGAKIGSDS